MTNVIACIDGGDLSANVAELGAWAAKEMESTLTLIHALDKSHQTVEPELSGNLVVGSKEALLNKLSTTDGKVAKAALVSGKCLLNQMEEHLKDGRDIEVEKLQRHGTLVDTLMDAEGYASLFVLGKWGEKHLDGTNGLGSQLEGVVRSSHKPILIATTTFKSPKSFALAFDGSEEGLRIAKEAASHPLLAEKKCHLVMVNQEASDITKKATNAFTANGREVVCANLFGDVSEAITKYQKDNNVEMIVMGGYGHSRAKQFFVGSTTTKIITNASAPTLIIK